MKRLVLAVVFVGIMLTLNGCAVYVPSYEPVGFYYGYAPYGGYGYGYHGFRPHHYGWGGWGGRGYGGWRGRGWH